MPRPLVRCVNPAKVPEGLRAGADLGHGLGSNNKGTTVVQFRLCLSLNPPTKRRRVDALKAGQTSCVICHVVLTGSSELGPAGSIFRALCQTVERKPAHSGYFTLDGTPVAGHLSTLTAG
jgi:hypothetical protein